MAVCSLVGWVPATSRGLPCLSLGAVQQARRIAARADYKNLAQCPAYCTNVYQGCLSLGYDYLRRQRCVVHIPCLHQLHSVMLCDGSPLSSASHSAQSVRSVTFRQRESTRRLCAVHACRVRHSMCGQQHGLVYTVVVQCASWHGISTWNRNRCCTDCRGSRERVTRTHRLETAHSLYCCSWGESGDQGSKSPWLRVENRVATVLRKRHTCHFPSCRCPHAIQHICCDLCEGCGAPLPVAAHPCR